MPRLAPLEAPYSDEVAETFTRLMPPGMEPLLLFRTLAHNPRVLRRIQRGGLLDPGSISVRQREIAILRTCARCGAAYEWGVHASLFGSVATLTDAEIDATWTGAALDSWTDDERLILRTCDALHESSALPDALWSDLETHFSPAQRIELVTLVGLYHAVSFIVNATGLDPEPWARTPPET